MGLLVLSGRTPSGVVIIYLPSESMIGQLQKPVPWPHALPPSCSLLPSQHSQSFTEHAVSTLHQAAFARLIKRADL